MALWGKGKHLFPPLDEKYDDRLIFITEDNKNELEKILRGKILFTPGHTNDSLSLKAGRQIFCGDAAMNGFPSRHRVTIWVENTKEFGQSWDTMHSENAEMIYPAHGKPFDAEDLVRHRRFIDTVRLRPLVKGE